jgi:trimethylamine--corrinoid protein Co-methyltransferase
LRKGIPVNEDTLASDTLKQVGPQGEFVTHPHTLTQFRSLYNPRLFDRSSYLQWEENGSEDIAVAANKEWKKRVGSYVRPELPKNIHKALRSYVELI